MRVKDDRSASQSLHDFNRKFRRRYLALSGGWLASVICRISSRIGIWDFSLLSIISIYVWTFMRSAPVGLSLAIGLAFDLLIPLQYHRHPKFQAIHGTHLKHYWPILTGATAFEVLVCVMTFQSMATLVTCVKTIACTSIWLGITDDGVYLSSYITRGSKAPATGPRSDETNPKLSDVRPAGRRESHDDGSSSSGRKKGDDRFEGLDRELEEIGYTDRLARSGMIDHLESLPSNEREGILKQWRKGFDEKRSKKYRERILDKRKSQVGQMPVDKRYPDLANQLEKWYPDPLVRAEMIRGMKNMDDGQAEFATNGWLEEEDKIRRRTAKYTKQGKERLDRGGTRSSGQGADISATGLPVIQDPRFPDAAEKLSRQYESPDVVWGMIDALIGMPTDKAKKRFGVWTSSDQSLADKERRASEYGLRTDEARDITYDVGNKGGLALTALSIQQLQTAMNQHNVPAWEQNRILQVLSAPRTLSQEDAISERLARFKLTWKVPRAYSVETIGRVTKPNPSGAAPADSPAPVTHNLRNLPPQDPSTQQKPPKYFPRPRSGENVVETQLHTGASGSNESHPPGYPPPPNHPPPDFLGNPPGNPPGGERLVHPLGLGHHEPAWNDRHQYQTYRPQPGQPVIDWREREFQNWADWCYHNRLGLSDGVMDLMYEEMMRLPKMPEGSGLQALLDKWNSFLFQSHSDGSFSWNPKGPTYLTDHYVKQVGGGGRPHSPEDRGRRREEQRRRRDQTPHSSTLHERRRSSSSSSSSSRSDDDRGRPRRRGSRSPSPSPSDHSVIDQDRWDVNKRYTPQDVTKCIEEYRQLREAESKLEVNPLRRDTMQFINEATKYVIAGLSDLLPNELNDEAFYWLEVREPPGIEEGLANYLDRLVLLAKEGAEDPKNMYFSPLLLEYVNRTIQSMDSDSENDDFQDAISDQINPYDESMYNRYRKRIENSEKVTKAGITEMQRLREDILQSPEYAKRKEGEDYMFPREHYESVYSERMECRWAMVEAEDLSTQTEEKFKEGKLNQDQISEFRKHIKSLSDLNKTLSDSISGVNYILRHKLDGTRKTVD